MTLLRRTFPYSVISPQAPRWPRMKTPPPPSRPRRIRPDTKETLLSAYRRPRPPLLLRIPCRRPCRPRAHSMLLRPLARPLQQPPQLHHPHLWKGSPTAGSSPTAGRGRAHCISVPLPRSQLKRWSGTARCGSVAPLPPRTRSVRRAISTHGVASVVTHVTVPLTSGCLHPHPGPCGP